jgi:hypothetical protein
MIQPLSVAPSMCATRWRAKNVQRRTSRAKGGSAAASWKGASRSEIHQSRRSCLSAAYLPSDRTLIGVHR